LRRYSLENDSALRGEITAHLGEFGIPPDRIVTNFVVSRGLPADFPAVCPPTADRAGTGEGGAVSQ